MWRVAWDKYKTESEMSSLFQDKPNVKGQYSGKLQNPRKLFFLKIAAHSVRFLNQALIPKAFILHANHLYSVV